MKVALLLLANPTVGGWPTFTAHLARGLLEIGMQPQLFRVSQKTEKIHRLFGRGLTYQNLNRRTAAVLPREMPTIITAVGKAHADTARNVVEAGADLVIHDPTELRGPEMDDLLGATTRPIVTIRPTVAKLLREKGLAAQTIPHPYSRWIGGSLGERKKHAIAYSRVDFDKGTHLIVEANMRLPREQQVEIWGALNRIYAHHKLDGIDPTWRRNYRGGWPAKTSLWQGAAYAASARYAVDLSAIKGDGGGTQYSFLEALDAGTPLIINRAWLTGDPAYDEISPAVSAFVNTAGELCEALAADLRFPKQASEALLDHHDAVRVARGLVENLWASPTTSSVGLA